ncbi:MAG: primosomal protein N', partial [Candidatus Geothermincolales bacterium]
MECLASMGGSAPITRLKEAMGKRFSAEALRQLATKGLLERSFRLPPPRVDKATSRFAEITPLGREWLCARDKARKYPARLRVLSILAERGGPMPSSELCREARCSPALLREMESCGLLEIHVQEVLRDPLKDIPLFEEDPPRMNRYQEEALWRICEAMDAGGGKVLLHGVTGSGKTEVYLKAIEEALERGLGCLVLVPEIALTPQMVQRFLGRFREEVAVLHSRLGLGERYDQWRGIRDGRYRVVIGARSAVFAPIPRLGIIVVDEEHETSYKQETSPRYHAVEVAAKRAEICGAVLVLGSATPRLETIHAARSGGCVLVSLPERVDGRKMPQVEIVDMREVRDTGGRRLLSPRLVLALAETIKRNEQAILFLNRRGFAPSLLCRDCGHIFKCSHCSVSLCWHARGRELLCHHCGFSLPHPEKCPICGSAEWKYAGAGTERVEEEIRKTFPHVPILRMDADTTRRKGAHFKIFREFQEGKARILVGTQMIAKGLDLPSVTLVGIIDADTSLTLPDFRASERTFQLITQVSGRAGRGERPGKV